MNLEPGKKPKFTIQPYFTSDGFPNVQLTCPNFWSIRPTRPLKKFKKKLSRKHENVKKLEEPKSHNLCILSLCKAKSWAHTLPQIPKTKTRWKEARE